MPAGDSGSRTPEPAPVRNLRRLVTLLTWVLILGTVTITGLLAWRMTRTEAAPPAPREIALPAGQTLQSYAIGPDWTVLIAEDAAGAPVAHFLRTGRDRIEQSVPIRATDG